MCKRNPLEMRREKESWRGKQRGESRRGYYGVCLQSNHNIGMYGYVTVKLIKFYS
jgi:hypothetical protein